MALIPRIRLWLARGLKKAAALPIIPPFVRESFLRPTWRALIKEGFKANAALYACVLELALAFAEPPLVVKDEQGDSLPTHPMQKLLSRPNPFMGEAQFATYLMTYMSLGGNVYLHKVRNRSGKVIELWPFHAGQISPIPETELTGRWVKAYEYDRGDGRKETLPVEDVIHIPWPTPDPDQPWMGLPPITAAAREVDTDNEAGRYVFALLKNDAVPRTLITMPDGSGPVDPETMKEFKKQFEERFGGAKRGSVAVLEGGADVSRISLDLQEMAFEVLRRVPEARIAAALRVPPILVGLNVGLERSTFTNTAEARKFFTEGTLARFWRLVANEITQGLEEDFTGVVAEYDLSQVRALQENETELWTRVNMAISGGWLTVNQGLGLLGLDEVAGQDVYLRSFNVLTEEAKSSNGSKNGRETKQTAQEAARHMARSLQAIRKSTAQNMEKELDKYFEELGQLATERAIAPVTAGKQAKVLPRVSDLLTPQDDDNLVRLVSRFLKDVLFSSWGIWNSALGDDTIFDFGDPAVAARLTEAGVRITMISDTTRDVVRDLLRHGNENNWGTDDLIRGDPEADPPVAGLRSIITETYKNRARAIARTELGNAQQLAAVDRYEAAGVKEVQVFDNGEPGDDDACKRVNGTTQTIEWAKANPLQHPNCTRAFAPIIGR